MFLSLLRGNFETLILLGRPLALLVKEQIRRWLGQYAICTKKHLFSGCCLPAGVKNTVLAHICVRMCDFVLLVKYLMN